MAAATITDAGVRTRLRRAATALLVCVAASHFAAEEEPAPRECGAASNCGGLGGWRLMLLAEPAPRMPELTVDRPGVVDGTLTTRQSFRLDARIRNVGRGAADATTLRWYRSADRTISRDDAEVGTDAVEALARGAAAVEAIQLRTADRAGSVYYGACVDAVEDESDLSNNCSGARVIGVETRTRFFGAVASGMDADGCTIQVAGDRTDDPDTRMTDARMREITDDALDDCRDESSNCRVVETWVRGCVGIALGVDRVAERCATYHYGGTASVSTASRARRGALDLCREDFRECQAAGGCDDLSTSGGARPGPLRTLGLDADVGLSH